MFTNSSYHKLVKKSTWALAIVVILSLAPAALAKIPNDPEYAQQQKMWEQVGAPTAWDYETGSKSVVVAIIDTGADTWHSDLGTNIWQNQYEIAGNKIDDDRNGYVDDINGWNFIEGNNNVRTSVLEAGDDKEAVRHGTIIAGIIGASGNNNNDGTGLNWQVRIMPLRAVDSSGSGLLSNIALAVDYAAANGANVISLSLVGNASDDNLRQSLRRAYDKGIVIVAAGGNDQNYGEGDLDVYPEYPVCIDKGDTENWILGVTSVREDNTLSGFANYGSCIDLAAPGSKVYSTERYAPEYNYIQEFGGPWVGTSFATPFVAGAAALLKAARPDWAAPQIISTLLATADNIDNLNPSFSSKLGKGRLNIGAAMKIAVADKPLPGKTLDNIYFITGNSIGRYNLNDNQKYLVSKINEAKLISLDYGDVNADNQEEVVVLFKRGSYYYVRILSQTGKMWREWAVNLNDYLKTGSQIKKLSVGESGVSQNTDDIVVGQIIKKKLTLSIFNDNQKIYSWQEKNISSLSSVDLGNVWGEEGEQIVLLGSQGNKIKQIIIDPESKSFWQDDLGVVNKKSPWRIWLGQINHGNALEILRLGDNGKWSVTDRRGAPLTTGQGANLAL
ncbi:MAG: Peptidase S8 and S53, subtilisin, kexin, sedolisin [Candidatus Magasanikbacteria bacterium GW2011_GWA2_37_8]|uniref:Peptidase S8 and S53, subtilisin, kexin, sedolisin n=1 Tax=Candidatus Magasanikbacteria bacterium GW2011_GWA2_37_8 TaxID=1619036 RepID=A0A0G0KI67_9BACT|nr:MAG: Peptidase S8 and S53, subtilisin, kexin, sedolisin [Candidatus Magasanikbacteria bacterium GW2011_GWA2_37_8]